MHPVCSAPVVLQAVLKGLYGIHPHCTSCLHCSAECCSPSLGASATHLWWLPALPRLAAPSRCCRPRRRSTLEEVQAMAQAGLDFIRSNVSINSIITGWKCLELLVVQCTQQAASTST